MAHEPDMTLIASLIGDPSRSMMLSALMGGEALTATELANESGVTKQTASSHLQKLVSGHLLEMEKQGRHHYYRIADSEVAYLLETIMTVSGGLGMKKTKPGPKDERLRRARVCYDHLAGEMGVKLLDSFMSKGLFCFSEGQQNQSQFMLNEKGNAVFQDFGIDTDLLNKAKRPVCRTCIDWSVRRPHLAGSLGAAILNQFYAKNWVIKSETPRLLLFTPKGEAAFRKFIS